MIMRDIIYANSIKEYIEYFRTNKLKFSIIAMKTEKLELLNLPAQAYYAGCLYCSFDFGAKETWLTDQIEIDENMFKAVLVYEDSNKWMVEYPIEFPIIDILGISKIEIKPREVTFNVTKHDKEFQIKVDNSKKHLRLL